MAPLYGPVTIRSAHFLFEKLLLKPENDLEASGLRSATTTRWDMWSRAIITFATDTFSTKY